jgi:hypothetical protein
VGGELAVEVCDEGVAGDLHGVGFQLVELVVAAVVGGEELLGIMRLRVKQVPCGNDNQKSK